MEIKNNITCKNVENQHLINMLKMDARFLVTLIKLLHFLYSSQCIKNQHTEFEINRTIITCLN